MVSNLFNKANLTSPVAVGIYGFIGAVAVGTGVCFWLEKKGAEQPADGTMPEATTVEPSQEPAAV